MPTNTWRPWNPVATKKAEPNALSAILNLASTYSIACNKVKYIPNPIVTIRPSLKLEWLPAIKAWWDQVTVTPEDNNTKVLSNGTSKGLNAIIPIGGQTLPTSTAGEILLWKKAQKKDRKKKTSETINKTIPQRRPNSTILVCNPWHEASKETSRHHWNITIKIIESPKAINEKE